MTCWLDGQHGKTHLTHGKLAPGRGQGWIGSWMVRGVGGWIFAGFTDGGWILDKPKSLGMNFLKKEFRDESGLLTFGQSEWSYLVWSWCMLKVRKCEQGLVISFASHGVAHRLKNLLFFRETYWRINQTANATSSPVEIPMLNAPKLQAAKKWPSKNAEC